MEEKGFSAFVGEAFNKAKKIKANPGMALGELGSWWWNRLPDQADRFTRPGIRNKINSAVGTGMVEAANFGTDAALQMALAGASLVAAPETLGGSILAHPATAWAANLAKDMAMSKYIEPELYDMADRGINLGGMIPTPPGYKGSRLQKNVNIGDKKVTDVAQWIAQNHPKNQAGNYAEKLGTLSKKIVP